MNSKTLFTALAAACVAVALAAAQPSSAGPGKAKGKAKATAAPVKQGQGKANGHQGSNGQKAGKRHSDDSAGEQAAPQPVAPQPVAPQPAVEGAGGASTESDVAVEEEPKNAAHACKAERDADAEAFANTHGTNGNKRNAFGKCVSKRAHEQNGALEDAETETDADAEEGGDSDGTGTDTDPSAPETGAGESSVPDGADAHERQQEQLAELIERLEELLADLKAQLGEGAAPAPAAP